MRATTGGCSMTDHTDDVQRALQELTRQCRLVDQGLTMQAKLRDRDRLIGTTLVCAILVLSVVGVAFAFAGADHLVRLVGITAARTTWLGWLSVGTLALALVELVLDRRGAAQRRADAVRVLAALKAEYRVPPAADEEIATAARMSERYAQAMETVPAVPERAFNRLKAKHLRKVEISKLLSDQPGMSYRRARALVDRRQKGVSP
jgi:hypothetical protein